MQDLPELLQLWLALGLVDDAGSEPRPVLAHQLHRAGQRALVGEDEQVADFDAQPLGNSDEKTEGRQSQAALAARKIALVDLQVPREPLLRQPALIPQVCNPATELACELDRLRRHAATVGQAVDLRVAPQATSDLCLDVRSHEGIARAGTVGEIRVQPRRPRRATVPKYASHWADVRFRVN